MRKSAVSKYLSMIAKRGGEARARTLTAQQRKAIATKASKAAAAARRRKAKERRAKVAEKISPEQRRQGVKKAAAARWRKDKKNREEAGESTIQSEPTRLTSEEETDSALVKSQLVEGVHLAMERNMILPFQLHVTGADDDLVCRLLCEKNGEREGWLRLRDMPDMPLSNTKLMTARFPMTATFTDSRGGTLQMTITR